MLGAVDAADDADSPTVTHDAGLERAEPLDVDVDGLAVDVEPVALRPDAAGPELVTLAAVAQVDAMAERVGRTGPAAHRGGVERRAVERPFGLVGVDRGAEQRHGGTAGGDVLARRGDAVEPARVDVAGAHLGPFQDVE